MFDEKVLFAIFFMLKTEPIGWNENTKKKLEKVISKIAEACKNTVSATAVEGMQTS